MGKGDETLIVVLDEAVEIAVGSASMADDRHSR